MNNQNSSDNYDLREIVRKHMVRLPNRINPAVDHPAVGIHQLNL